MLIAYENVSFIVSCSESPFMTFLVAAKTWRIRIFEFAAPGVAPSNIAHSLIASAPVKLYVWTQVDL